MSKEDEQIRELIHTPAQLGCEYLTWAQGLKDMPGVPFGIPAVDKHVIPFHPGDMVTFVARPGHGKTSILAYLARAEAKRIVERDTLNTECVVYVTWEQVTEEINATLEATDKVTVTDIVSGSVDLKLIEHQAAHRVGMPIWMVGESLSRTTPRSVRLFPENVFRAIELIREEHGKKPTLMLFDYIQMIPIPARADRMEQVMEAAHRCKELAKRVGCPAAVAVQARREVDERKLKIPGLQDAQWASSIEQTADKYFSLWRPWQTEDRTAQIDIGGTRYPVTPELLVMQMQKQRFADGHHTWVLHFNPAYLKLCQMEKDIDEVPGHWANDR